jgi:fructose-1,6-bisphosphatase/inositol monophosphatase family enzyme
MNGALTTEIEALLRRVAADVVMPRFQALAVSEIIEKSPGELVTIADHESELRLADGLSELLPEALIVGEEAAAVDPTLLDQLDAGLVWLIDPIDGTSNFAEGISPFALMVALLENGTRVGGWIYDPVADRLCHAALGGGAFINDQRVQARESGQSSPVAALATRFMPPQKRADVEARAFGQLTIAPIPRCAGDQYPQIVLGMADVALFERSLPWDHAAGALFLEEAGGVIARTDGSNYLTGDRRIGLLGASSQRMWDAAARILFR